MRRRQITEADYPENKPAPLPPEDLGNEKTIEWDDAGPDFYPYLRESFTVAKGRTKKPRCPGRIVAFATLKPDATGYGDGFFHRRVWYFDKRDFRPKDFPAEAVEPASIKAGKPSKPKR